MGLFSVSKQKFSFGLDNVRLFNCQLTFACQSTVHLVSMKSTQALNTILNHNRKFKKFKNYKEKLVPCRTDGQLLEWLSSSRDLFTLIMSNELAQSLLRGSPQLAGLEASQ